MYKKLKNRIYLLLNPAKGNGKLDKVFDYFLVILISLNVVAVILETVANKDKNFGNARFVRNLFEKTIERQANRLSREVNLTNEKLSEICFVDIPCY